uniref:SCP domain-containing protein n=1 Tax=Bionectria ochroleuca TaxID=29856 RepID=A0A8H7NJE0_BIOOC
MLFSALSLQALALFATSVIADATIDDDTPLNITKTVQDPPNIVSYAGKPEYYDERRASRSIVSEAKYAELLNMPPPNVSADQLESLRLHNAARAGRRLKAVIWDPTLESAARDWANYIAGINSLEHSSSAQRPNQGENLAYSKSSAPILNPASIGTQLWLDEVSNYHGEAIPKGNFQAYGHYTQCMWSTTYKIGVATAQAADGSYYTVARYSPPGNIVGKVPYGTPPSAATG